LVLKRSLRSTAVYAIAGAPGVATDFGLTLVPKKP
jgi:hypothetical protein